MANRVHCKGCDGIDPEKVSMLISVDDSCPGLPAASLEAALSHLAMLGWRWEIYPDGGEDIDLWVRRPGELLDSEERHFTGPWSEAAAWIAGLAGEGGGGWVRLLPT